MKNELEYICKNYVKNKQIEIFYYFDEKEANEIINYLFQSVSFNHPDFYYVDNKICYMFEHFEVDASYHSIHGGSKYIQDRIKVDKEIDDESVQLVKDIKPKQNEVTYAGTISKTICQNANINYLKENFENSFNHHYNQISKYQETLRDKEIIKNQRTTMVFVIEHTTDMGGFYLKDGECKSLNIEFLDFVISKMEASNDVEYFIFLEKSNHTFSIIKRDNLFKLKENLIDTKKNTICIF